MHYGRNHTLLGNARTLRKNMTKEERHLWFDFLRYCRPVSGDRRSLETISWTFSATRQNLLLSWTVLSTAKLPLCNTMHAERSICKI